MMRTEPERRHDHRETSLFAAKLQSLLDRAGLTQDELARRVAGAMKSTQHDGRSRPPSRSTIARFLAGRSVPRLDTAWFLARILDTTIDGLVDSSEGRDGTLRTLTRQELEIVELAAMIGHGLARERLLLLPSDGRS